VDFITVVAETLGLPCKVIVVVPLGTITNPEHEPVDALEAVIPRHPQP